ncbi:MAG: imelysin family protein [Hyphomonadaceae bacterium]|jgi:hypothetical protein|nr:imelysin family protein [Hyphomonadaceae bacterium]
MIQRRHLTTSLLALIAVAPLSSGLRAQAGYATAFPFYKGEQALAGLYGHHMPPLARAFDTEAQGLVEAARVHCAGPTALPVLREAWRRTLLAWTALSTPALGPVIERRSHRQIDFWPPRPALLDRALNGAPQTLADMERVGAPAKGLPTLERLITGTPIPAHCPYLLLIAEGIAAEARALRSGFETLAARDWTEDENTARAAFAEWINQWLGGLERLRWMHIEQPLQRARTAGNGQAPAFARQSAADNQAEWRAQWAALRAQARLVPGQAAQPPQAAQDMIPIEALLLGKGQIALAQRWVAALDAADAAIAGLPAKADDKELLGLSKTLKGVTTLYQTEVATALDVPLGFSDADGD